MIQLLELVSAGLVQVWLTSDMHFGHFNIVDKGWRPFDSVDHMTEVLVANWNANVGEDDVVIILGDTVMGKFLENVTVLGRLNGNKFLMAGNHDRFHPSYDKRDWKREEWREVYERYVTTLPEQFNMTYAGIDFTLCHFPFDGDHTEEMRFPEYRPVNSGQFLLHGHVHDSWKMNGKQINVGLDVWDFAPVNINTIIDLINREFHL